jgi:CRISPR-associated protein Cas1
MRAKIQNQAALLRHQGHEIENMLHWAESVRSGDPENMEGRASAWYWSKIFNAPFVRDPAGPPPNNLLNYGYAILRASVARALVGSGLLPTVGIFHRNQYNAYCLADDIMEPYRPFVDRLVVALMAEQQDSIGLAPEVKKKLLVIPAIDVVMAGETSPLSIALQHTTASLARCFLGETRKLAYPQLQ